MIVKGVSIGDLHFGIKDSSRLYDELSQFKDFIRKNDIDLLVINGDYFDSKLSVGDPATLYAMLFFKDLIDIIKEKSNNGKKIAFRIIQGTRSHDLNQLQLFKPYENDSSIDFRIIESADEENILGLNILYIPEEYPENSDEYYSKYKEPEKNYNVAFVHGTFDFVAQPGVIEHSKLSTYSAPVFVWKEWKEHFKNGFVSAGHIHGRNTYGNKIFYPGSFTRWSYGERSEKGFTYFEIDNETGKYLVNYIDNEKAPKYDVISLSDLNVDLSTTPVNILQEMLDLEISKTDNLRIDISGISKENIDILRKYYVNNPKVKIEVREKKVLLKESKASSSEEFKKWHYITKRELPLDETIVKFANEELSQQLKLDDVRNILKDEG